MQHTNILTKRFTVAALFALLVLLVTATISLAAAPNPAYGTAVVDGSSGEWDLNNDYFAPVYQAGKSSKPTVADLYARYSCTDQVLYLLVLSRNGYPVSVENGNQVFVKFDGTKVASSNSTNDGTLPDFAWINSNGSEAAGYEYAISLTSGSTIGLKVHHNFNNGGDTASPSHGNDTIDLTPVCGRIGDRIWWDDDMEGDQDPSEVNINQAPGLNGVAVTLNLINADTNEIVATTTTTNGDYIFENLPPGNYNVDIDDTPLIQNGYFRTSAFDPYPVTLSLNTVMEFLDADFGYDNIPDGCAMLGDYVWNDKDQELDQDADELPFEGMQVTLNDGYEACPGFTVNQVDYTDSFGRYTFGPLAYGNYTTTILSPVDGEEVTGRIVIQQNALALASLAATAAPETFIATDGTTRSTTLDAQNNVDLTLDFPLVNSNETAVTLQNISLTGDTLTGWAAAIGLLLLTLTAVVWSRRRSIS